MDSLDKLPQLEKMRMGVEYSFRVQLRDFSCEVRPLANSEVTKCYGAVTAQMSKLVPSSRTQLHQDNLLAREFLKYASSPFEHWAPQITDSMLDQMTNDEIMYLYKEWLAVCDKVNPLLETLPLDTIELLVAELKKSPPEDLVFQLTELSFGQTRSLVHYLLTNAE